MGAKHFQRDSKDSDEKWLLQIEPQTKYGMAGRGCALDKQNEQKNSRTFGCKGK